MTDASRVRMACLAAPASHLHKHGPAGCFLSPHSYIFGYILRNDLIVYLYYFICIYLCICLFCASQLTSHVTVILPHMTERDDVRSHPPPWSGDKHLRELSLNCPSCSRSRLVDVRGDRHAVGTAATARTNDGDDGHYVQHPRTLLLRCSRAQRCG
jgi:hypothetical protein